MSCLLSFFHSLSASRLISCSDVVSFFLISSHLFSSLLSFSHIFQLFSALLTSSPVALAQLFSAQSQIMDHLTSSLAQPAPEPDLGAKTQKNIRRFLKVFKK
jgi:hypothetical protein